MTIKENRSISVKEAGRKGGAARAEKYTKKELSEQAKRGAQTIENEEPGFHAEIGKLGGEARAEKYSKEELSEQAKRGAQTVERTRPGFHSEIGRKGGQSSGGGAVKKSVPAAQVNHQDEYQEESEDEGI